VIQTMRVLSSSIQMVEVMIDWKSLVYAMRYNND